jgi:hypothetical protein
MKPYQGPAPDPGPPKDPPAEPRYNTGTRPLSDGTQLVAGTLTTSPSTRENAIRGANGGPGQKLIDTLRGWPLQKKVAAGGGLAAAIILLLVVALRSPSAEEGNSLAATSQTAAVAPSSAPITIQTPPSAAPTGAESAPLEVDLSDMPVAPQPQAPSNPSNVPPRDDRKAPQTLKPIPPGKARIFITGQGGSCSASVNSRFVGSTPVSVFVPPGTMPVSCITSDGKPMMQQVTVRAGETKPVGFLVTGRTPSVKDP